MGQARIRAMAAAAPGGGRVHPRVPPADRAVIGYITPGNNRNEFMRSVVSLTLTDPNRITAVISVQTGGLLAGARNTVVRMFLEEHTAPWLWMVDTDMVFTPDALARLTAAADPHTRPIVGGLCFGQGPDGEPLPTLYELGEHEGRPGFGRYTEWPEDDLMEVGATGAACLLVHRAVYLAVQAGVGRTPDPVFPWFKETALAGRKAIGEDLTFCLRAKNAGFKTYVHTGVQVGHVKTTVVGKVR